MTLRAPLLLALLAITACVPARRKVEGTIVRDIAFTGNGGALSGHNDYQLRQHMAQQETRFGLLVWPLLHTVTPRTLDERVLLRDAWRLEVWYAHHGWFDARVNGFEIRQVRRGTERRAAVVDIRGHLEPGEQSTVRRLEIQGMSRYRAIENAVLRTAPIREGDTFSLDYVDATRDLLITKLHDAAHPYATVETSIEAHPEELAVDIVFHVDPGITARFGPVALDGAEDVPERFIERRAEIVEGDPYRFEALRQARRRLFELGTFSVVSVEPDLSDPSRAQVPIAIRVTEAKFRTLRLGVGFDYDTYVPVIRATARIRHVNLLHQLLQAELGVRGGFAFDVTGDVSGRIPTWGVDFAVQYPRLFAQRGSIELRGNVEQDIYGGLWAYRRPEANLHLVYRFSDDVIFRIGPHVEQYTFLGEFGPQVRAAQQRLFGIESEAAFVYQLTALDQFATWDWRDDPLHTTRGQYYALSLREAVPLSSYGYGFVRAAGDATWFVPLRFGEARGAAYPFTWIVRTGGTAIVPYTASKTVPLPERAFLGGSNSIRGFRANQVGPYTALCTYRTVTRRGFLGLGEERDEEEVSRYYLPSGANYAVEAGTEVRYDWAYGVSFAAFLDAGALLDTVGPGALSDDPLRGSAGLGVRYDTKIGPLRFDVSVRPLYPEDRGPLRFTQCRPVDAIPRVSDLFSNFDAWRAYEDRPPFALVFFLTIGEAI